MAPDIQNGTLRPHPSPRKSAGEIPRASPADLDRLRAAMQGDIDTAEIPERRKFQRLKRDANGKLPPGRTTIRRRDLTFPRPAQSRRAHATAPDPGRLVRR